MSIGIINKLIMGSFLGIFLVASFIGCNTSNVDATFKVGGIPDQDSARLARRYDSFANYLSKELGVKVEYVPSVNYAAVVNAFGKGDLDAAFFGGLTGVQARLQNPGSVAVAQRENDAKFHSKFIARKDLNLTSLEDLKSRSSELSITFGSESSTSGHLMPRKFLKGVGIEADSDFSIPSNFSGSHDLTWQLVESGSFDIGALSEAVWARAVEEQKVDTTLVDEFYTTPDYFDYNWTIRPGLDEIYGEGFSVKFQQALLKLNGEEHQEILELFSTDKFISTQNSNYDAIEQVARELKIIQ
ncbi:MAG: putative selenate ABC transporter substrate-binding protein [Dehalococcoidia bacterium]|nr:putative selenate ABC transporter substrate-binding protein [Dehalococcoidia bacterium]